MNHSIRHAVRGKASASCRTRDMNQCITGNTYMRDALHSIIMHHRTGMTTREGEPRSESGPG